MPLGPWPHLTANLVAPPEPWPRLHGRHGLAPRASAATLWPPWPCPLGLGRAPTAVLPRTWPCPHGRLGRTPLSFGHALTAASAAPLRPWPISYGSLGRAHWTLAAPPQPPCHRPKGFGCDPKAALASPTGTWPRAYGRLGHAPGP